MLKLFFKYWLPVLLYAVLIFYISSIKALQIPPIFILSDYILHAIEYLPFGFLMCRAIKNTKDTFPSKKIFIASIVLVFLYAASDEFHQSFIPGRFASLIDLFADTIGANIGIRLAI